MIRKPLGGPPTGLTHFTTEANKGRDERTTNRCCITSEVNCITTTPNPEIVTDYLKQDLIFVGRNLVARVINDCHHWNTWYNKKNQQKEPGLLPFDPLDKYIYLGIQARVCRLGNRTLVTEDASETPLCFGSSIFESIFAYDRCATWCWKTIEQHIWFWAFCWWTHEAGGSPLDLFKKSGRFYCRVGFMGWLPGCFFFGPTSSLRC